MNQPSPKDYKIWTETSVAQNFLEGVRSAIPLAAAQIDCLLRIINLTQSQVNCFLDLGCGNGILGQAISEQYPQARGVFIDISPSMLEAAQNSIDNASGKYSFLLQDFALSSWSDALNKITSFDVIVSGFAIHHQPDSRKQGIYQEIYNPLKPGGIFLNLEHIASASSLGETAFDELFIDSLYAYHQLQNPNQSKNQIAQQYYSRDDKNANILTLPETQCQWLKEIGFTDVDCFFRILEIALFGGIKPN